MEYVSKNSKIDVSPNRKGIRLLVDIDDLRIKSAETTYAKIESCASNHNCALEFLQDLPTTFLPIQSWNISREINLADLKFNTMMK